MLVDKANKVFFIFNVNVSDTRYNNTIVIIVFFDPENIGINTIIKFLSLFIADIYDLYIFADF